MSDLNLSPESIRARVARFCNPYRFIELEDDSDSGEPSDDEKHIYLKTLQNPWASESIFPQTEATSPTCLAKGTDRLGVLLDEVLQRYKRYVARTEWEKVIAFRPEFLTLATRNPATSQQVTARLEQLKFSLMPGEKVEYNRAPADRIISELKRLLI